MKKDQIIQVEDIVEFGRYPQDADGTIRPLTWRVLDRKDDSVLMITEYGIDTKPYHERYEDVTWEHCSLRYWLNHDFLDVAFTDIEEASILLTDVDNSKAENIAKYHTSGGNNTKDKVFLLSYREAFKKYFLCNEARRSIPTDYAKNKAFSCRWWLRSPGNTQNYAAIVNFYDPCDINYVTYDHGCVRPVLWVNSDHLTLMQHKKKQSGLGNGSTSGEHNGENDEIADLLEKQIPMGTKKSDSGMFYICPSCNKFLERNEQSTGNIDIPYCKWCGQKLLWPDK